MRRSWPVLIMVLIACATLSVVGDEGSGRRSIEVGGRTRTWHLHLPPPLDPERPRPLVVVLHGGGGNGRGMRILTRRRFESLADREGFVVAYPDGWERNWNDTRVGAKDVDDLAFLSAMIDAVAAEIPIDPHRVYATGISNGGMMSLRLAYDLSARFAAVAAVTASMPENLMARPAPTQPVAVMLIDGTADRLVPWEGGRVGGRLADRGRVVSVDATVAFWVRHDGCRPKPDVADLADRDPDDGTRIRRETYGGGRGGSEVVLVCVTGGGHTWPGGVGYLPERVIGKTSRDVDACDVIWEFFERHARR